MGAMIHAHNTKEKSPFKCSLSLDVRLLIWFVIIYRHWVFRNHNDRNIRDGLTKCKLTQSGLRKEDFSLLKSSLDTVQFK